MEEQRGGGVGSERLGLPFQARNLLPASLLLLRSLSRGKRLQGGGELLGGRNCRFRG